MRMTIVLLAFSFLLAHNCTAGESDVLDKYLSSLPDDLQLREDGPQNYKFTCDYLYVDVKGDLIRKQRVYGEYTRALPEGKVRWNNVSIAQAVGFDDPFPEGEKQDYMEGFTYKPGSDSLKPEFFQGFPATAIEAKNLVWDTAMFEGFAWSYLDKLELNETYYPSEPVGEFGLAGAGTFQNKQIELTWLGISRMNEEICALIQYRAFLNKLNVSTGDFNVRGGSHYWGEIWVSLEDKQIEHGTLYENVVVETKMPGQENWQVGTVFRRGVFEKMIDEK